MTKPPLWLPAAEALELVRLTRLAARQRDDAVGVGAREVGHRPELVLPEAAHRRRPAGEEPLLRRRLRPEERAVLRPRRPVGFRPLCDAQA